MVDGGACSPFTVYCSRMSSYWRLSRSPRYSLLFALPLLLLYETLAFVLSHDALTGVRNGADVLLKSVFIELGGRIGLIVFGLVLLGGGAVLVRRDGGGLGGLRRIVRRRDRGAHGAASGRAGAARRGPGRAARSTDAADGVAGGGDLRRAAVSGVDRRGAGLAREAGTRLGTGGGRPVRHGGRCAGLLAIPLYR